MQKGAKSLLILQQTTIFNALKQHNAACSMTLAGVLI